ncbi:hypothetical protein THUN1379_31120 [Paludibacterium sp. THUN1379]|nr:hypothetical protein THUN1379_31120 [Paludibacterium sp. THUN1379]
MFNFGIDLSMHTVLCKVAIVGPESCGKTTLAMALQQKLQTAGMETAVVAEYARAYYAERAYVPTPGDVLAIARGQLAAEAEAAAGGARILLCDSTVLTCLIWARVAFGTVEPALARLYDARDYALTLLPRPDIPWTPDPLRSHPQQREMLLGLYREALRFSPAPVVEIAGEGPQRIDLAWQALRQICPDLPKF